MNWASKGAIPSVTAEKNCSANGIDVKVSNDGEPPSPSSSVTPSTRSRPVETKTVTVPVGEDEAYDITVTGPDGFSERSRESWTARPRALLPRAPVAAAGPLPPARPPRPVDTDGGATGETTAAPPATPLAARPAAPPAAATRRDARSSSATPMIAGLAVALVAAGGAALFFLRRKKPAGQ
ncbi:LAETG motif-containing sortase-dependent surface protein [Streptomyces sp. CBG31]|uniref:LAETG motif-containing sortase-dependent surface protein n=1 Tax=Streptomyces sp. CBG31 TaxID=2762623 RepID=UPI0021BD0376|nr:LAETG motif-containing sortase-dependent surface protein [Streptomyces sp. CBG31]